MPSPRRPLSSSSGSGSSPPPRPPESPTEVLYNTAVQSFVRRDHLKTHAALARLLSTLKGQSRKQARRRWHDLSASTSGGGPVAGTSTVNGGSTTSDGREADNEVEEWLIKTFKLYISAHASLYSDPPSQSVASTLSTDLLGLIPPHPPSKVLEHVTNTALQAYPDGILPPPVISTLVLASLKLQPQDDALRYTHRVTEEWLANLPNAFMEGISVRERGGVSRRVEAGREGYLKVLELFTGEVLAREGEWEMARGILDGDTLMGSKRKEALYRHLRASQARREAPETASASSSGILPSPSASLVLPDSSSPSATATPPHRSRSRSSSASSSEATARPPSQFPLSSTGASLARHISSTFRHPLAGNEATSKGKGKAESVTTTSESTLPSKIVVNPPGSGSGSGPGGNNRRGNGRHRDSVIRNRLLSMVNFGFLPASVRNRLWGLSTTQLASLVLPVPVLALLLLYAAIRRRRSARVASAGVALVGGQNGIEDIRARLAAARRQGLWAWVVWFFQWWMAKVAGVWKLGTTITYV